VVVGRGRSTSREGLGRNTSLDDQKRRASLSRVGENMCRRLKKEEDRTKRFMNDLIRRLPGGGDIELNMDSPACDLDSSISDAFSESSQGSPTSKMCRDMSKATSACYRSQRNLTKVVMKVLQMDSVVAARPPPKTASAQGLPAEEAPPASFVLPPPTDIDWRKLLIEAPELSVDPLPLPQLLPPGGLAGPKAPPATDLIAGLEFTSPPATPQPEEEAEGPLPRKSGAEETTLLPRKSKLLAAEEALIDEKVVVNGSRNSVKSDVEPLGEPQPLGRSPRDPIEELSSSTDTPLSPGGAASSSYAGRPSASGPEHEEGLEAVTEADSSLDSSGLEGDEVSASLEEVLADYSAIRPCEDGMERICTMLHSIEQENLRRELYIQVPSGIGPDRKVTFCFENKSHEVAVPEGYEVGQQVLITLSNRPFLERTAAQALRRGHPQPEFPDRWSIIDNLRHSLRNDAESSHLDADEFRHRYNMYMLLRGRCGTPLLPFTLEDLEEEAVGASA
jgi:hypothetical protein